MVIVDDLYEWFNLAALCLGGFRHSTGNGGRIALNACDKSMGERMRLGAGIERLYYDDLQSHEYQSARTVHFDIDLEETFRDSLLMQ